MSGKYSADWWSELSKRTAEAVKAAPRESVKQHPVSVPVKRLDAQREPAKVSETAQD